MPETFSIDHSTTSGLIDLRSDTVTRPTLAMRQAMSEALVGDDMVGEDPTVNLLQEEVAKFFGFDSALFVPSGTMSNQIAIKAHTQPGDEILCDESCHIYTWEAGGPAFLSGVTCRTLHTPHGVISVEHLEDKIRPNNQHYVQTRMVIVENTHNRGGGVVHSLERLRELRNWTQNHDLILHCDGARIWNAIVATGIPAKEWAACFDSLSVCFSKGLGAPIGSALLGSTKLIEKAKRIRKVFGGAMRQAGIPAAGALYGFRHNIDRIADDHRHAQLISQAIRQTPGLILDHPHPPTNLVWFNVDPNRATGDQFVQALKTKGVLLSQAGSHLCRAVTHLDVSKSQAEYACKAITSAFNWIER